MGCRRVTLPVLECRPSSPDTMGLARVTCNLAELTALSTWRSAGAPARRAAATGAATVRTLTRPQRYGQAVARAGHLDQFAVVVK